MRYSVEMAWMCKIFINSRCLCIFNSYKTSYLIPDVTQQLQSIIWFQQLPRTGCIVSLTFIRDITGSQIHFIKGGSGSSPVLCVYLGLHVSNTGEGTVILMPEYTKWKATFLLLLPIGLWSGYGTRLAVFIYKIYIIYIYIFLYSYYFGFWYWQVSFVISSSIIVWNKAVLVI